MCKISDEVIEAILQEGKIYEVGGAVRDRLMNRGAIVKDRDYLVCGIPYRRLSELLKDYGQVDLVGKSFGVIKFTQYKNDNRFTFDIALPRREISTGAGHKDFKVDFDPDLKVEDDLYRRDFTINAMAVSLENEKLIDPYGGKKDLDEGLIRKVAEISFEDDPLRMLRAIQFAARFEFDIEEKTYQSIQENADLIENVSAERIAEELNKLLVLAEKPSLGLRMMQKTGLLKIIMPEVEEMVAVDQPGGYHKYDVFEHTMYAVDATPKVLHLRLAALFHDISKPQTKRVMETKATFYGHEKIGAKIARKVLSRLRYSKDIIRKVMALVDRHMFTTDVTDKGMRRLIRKVGPDLIFDLLDLRRADVEAQGMGGSTEDVDEFEGRIREEIEKKPPFSPRDLAIDGHDIMKEFSLEPSPIIGKIIEYLMNKVLDEPSDNTREKLFEYARSYLANRNNKVT